MESIPRTLTLVLLSLWNVGAAPSPNGTTPFALQPKDAVDAEYSGMLFPRFFDSLEDQSRDSKHGGVYKLDPGQTVTIQSPNYPDRFPYQVKKKWTFLGTSTSSTISITCTDVTLDSCKYSSLTIWGQNLRQIYCDTQSTFTATSENNHLNVRFFSRFLKNYGFQCTVTASETTTTTSTSTSTTSTSTTSTATTSTSTTSTSTTSTTTTTPEPYQCQCGRRNPVERIIGGQETTVHEYPWQVAITFGTSTPICGGAIISDKWILTAASCVDGSDVTVVVREHDWSVTDETSITQMIVPSTIIMHPKYDRTTRDHDVALIELPSAVNFSPDNTIAPVCLPDEDNDYSDVDATVTGWGVLQGGSQSETLQEVVVPTMTNAACANIFTAVTDNMICTETDDGGPCVGDLGSPLVAPSNTDETFMVEIGIVSWDGCGSSGDPTVYTRVSKYLSWINKIIAGSVTCPRP
ncbi:trypsin Tyr p 3.0101-like isoform X3 [Palaemon carinicauda]|uniref:trypsin Tyr p 3.0101-like isoform X3 n=1 Tax=Palaemon carinicauda TaxID=392227 RepID=UPI0035B62624